jgi:hypothetical protein
MAARRLGGAQVPVFPFTSAKVSSQESKDLYLHSQMSEAFLKTTTESCLAQSEPLGELVVSHDNSTDGTADIVAWHADSSGSARVNTATSLTPSELSRPQLAARVFIHIREIGVARVLLTIAVPSVNLDNLDRSVTKPWDALTSAGATPGCAARVTVGLCPTNLNRSNILWARPHASIES